MEMEVVASAAEELEAVEPVVAVLVVEVLEVEVTEMAKGEEEVWDEAEENGGVTEASVAGKEAAMSARVGHAVEKWAKAKQGTAAMVVAAVCKVEVSKVVLQAMAEK